MRGYKVAVVGATGAVGIKMREILEERDFPVDELFLFASAASKGRQFEFKGRKVSVQELTKTSFTGLNFALFSAGAKVSSEFCPIAASNNAIAIDNSSYWRMDPDVPLVVPEVNPKALIHHNGIIGNPNCSTIQLVVVLKPIHDFAKIKRIVVSTYQAVSGKGLKAIEELKAQTANKIEGKKITASEFPHEIAFNVIPHIDSFTENGYTKEEIKVINETKKIMGADIPITVTAVRVPVINCHSESINIETEKKITADDVRKILSNAPGVKLLDDVSDNKYPMPVNADGRDQCFAGRIREDNSVKNGINLWVVADNLRKGAALNAVQIAELLVSPS